ncbi:MAG: UDP-N-acetylmuramoyl-tripeptide--D-alanyl-D-alanine ligase [Chloroflexi bacterium]|nr:UDP-N-acetylmuramoyl-tripeptide--D-alanyl-D-alanine ligase [Chloroflexota bacterium]
MLTLADVFHALTGARLEKFERVAILNVVIDSRQARAGSLFIALQGETRDGHAFIGEAFERGAVAAIAEPRAHEQGLGPRVHWVQTTGVAGLQPSPALEPPIVFVAPSSVAALQKLAAAWRRKFPQCKTIGITGSIGKSSTKELIAAVLQRRFVTLKSEGNLNNEIGLPLSVLQMNASHQRAVLEMGMYARGEIKTLCEIATPTIGVVTNVGPSHLERLGSIERIAQAKSELVEALPADGVAILNGDDARVRAMAAQTRARVFYYGLEPHCDLWADEIESLGLNGIALTLHRNNEHLHARVPLLGRHSVHTALAAASVGMAESLAWDEILKGLADPSAQLRLIAAPAENGATILDDTYNASPTSSLAALNLIAELAGRKIVVLGEMLELGALGEEGHTRVGGRAARIAQILIVVGARARWIAQGARAAGMASANIFFAETNQQAIDRLRGMMRAGDLVLVKGSRGARMEEIVAALALPSEAGGKGGWRTHSP